MSTFSEVKAAEERMNQVRTALTVYVERRAPHRSDIKLHLQLAETLKLATDEYVRLVSELVP